MAIFCIDDPDIIFQFDEDKTKLGISCESSAENLASSNQTHHSTPPLSAGLPQKVPHPLSSPTGASGLSGGLQQTKISSGTSPVTASVNIALPLNVSHGHGNSSNVNVSSQQHYITPTTSTIPSATGGDDDIIISKSTRSDSTSSSTSNNYEIGGVHQQLPLGETGRNRSHSVFCARHPNSNSKSTRFISFIKPVGLIQGCGAEKRAFFCNNCIAVHHCCIRQKYVAGVSQSLFMCVYFGPILLSSHLTIYCRRKERGIACTLPVPCAHCCYFSASCTYTQPV